MTVQDVIPYGELNTQTIESFLNDGFVRIEEIFRSSDDVSIPVEIDIHSLSVDGKALCAVVARDITERKRNEEENILNEQRFKALYQLSRMIDESEQTILDRALDEAVRMTRSDIGYIFLLDDEETELTLYAWSDAVMDKCKVLDQKAVFKVSEAGLWADAVKKRRPIITNDYANHADKHGLPEGHIAIKRHMNLPVMNGGRAIMLAGVANKDQEYTELDVMQLSLIMDATWRVIQRKRMEKDLREAKLSAETANVAKSRFLANMSHELRTPLNGIMGMTQILMGTELTPDQKEYLSLSLDATRHLSKVLTDLLSLSIVEAGKLELSSTIFNLRKVLDELTTPLALQAKEKSLTLNLVIAPTVPQKVCADAAKLRQILTNIIFNAIKFTESGSITLTVSAKDLPSEGNAALCSMLFKVTDTGIGIPKDQHDAIFDSFTLGEDHMTKQYGGTGLGLSISQQLATLMGGNVRVHSAPGHGSTFDLTIPMLIDESETPATPTIQHEDISALNILLAEDEQVNSIMASRLLKKAGHDVTIVGNGQQAIEKLSAQPFDLVLMDVQMPVVNGVQATEIIRNGGVENVPRNLPIIGLTAFARASEKRRFLEAGMQQIVTKPYEADELLHAIATTIHAH